MEFQKNHRRRFVTHLKDKVCIYILPFVNQLIFITSTNEIILGCSKCNYVLSTQKLSKLDEPDMQDTAGDVRTDS